MILKKAFLLISFVCLTYNSIAQTNPSQTQAFHISDSVDYIYSKPKFFDLIRHVPNDVIEFGKFTIQKENLKWTGMALASTALIIPFDQQLTDAASDLGSGINWDKDHSYDKLAGVFRVIPNDINSAAYYIGNGGTTMLLSGAFYAFGKINNNYRALNTSSELIEVLISVGVITQTIKRITGRQSPNRAIKSGHPGGHWTPFPSFKAYQTNTPNYDAMPSGHVATFMATLTVIATNYPEIKWIKPVGYTLLGITAFNMISSKVHWVSDYPIALLIGYVIGKNAANRRITKRKRNPKSDLVQRRFKTDFSFNYTPLYKTVGVSFTF